MTLVVEVSGAGADPTYDQRRPHDLLTFCRPPAGNVLNFNVGDGVKFALPNVFWTRLSGKYGTTFFVKENGMDLAVTNAVEAIVSCLRSEDGYCTSPPDVGVSLKSLGM